MMNLKYNQVKIFTEHKPFANKKNNIRSNMDSIQKEHKLTWI